MARQAEDISKIEDIGERLDALLDALETSSSEVARVGSALDKPLAELLAEEPAPKPEAKPVPEVPVTEPEVAAVAEIEPEVEASVAEPDVEPEPAQEAEAPHEPESAAKLDLDPEPVAEAGVVAASTPDSASDAGADAEPEAVEPETEPEVEADGELAPDADPAEDDTELDDGLLIEPESYQNQPTDDIDGAPVGPLNLEEELDEELESLLDSGAFEDPMAEMGVDESAEPLELPEESLVKDEAPPEPEERTSNLPTDEAELIGELDDQLAALADAQLAEPDLAEPVEASEPAAAPVAEPASTAAAAPETTAESAPEPEIVTKPVVPIVVPKKGWRRHAERAMRVAKPVAEKAFARGCTLAVAGATRASAPLKDKPHVKQVVGWVALVHMFYAACIWTYLSLWHNPPQPPPETPQPTIVAPGEG